MAPLYSLPEIPDLAIKVVQKFPGYTFLRSMRTCKWIKRLAEQERHAYVKFLEDNTISISAEDVRTKDFSEICKQIEIRKYFRLAQIQLKNFETETDFLLDKLLPVMRKAKIQFEEIVLINTNDTGYLQTFFDVLRAKNYVCDRTLFTGPWPIVVPHGLDIIKFILRLDEAAVIDEICRTLVGRSKVLIVEWHFVVSFEMTMKFMKATEDHGHSQKIKFILLKKSSHGTETEDDRQEIRRFIYEIDAAYRTFGHCYVLQTADGLIIAAEVAYVGNGRGALHERREMNCQLIRTMEELEDQCRTLFPFMEPSFEPILLSSLRSRFPASSSVSVAGVETLLSDQVAPSLSLER